MCFISTDKFRFNIVEVHESFRKQPLLKGKSCDNLQLICSHSN